MYVHSSQNCLYSSPFLQYKKCAVLVYEKRHLEVHLIPSGPSSVELESHLWVAMAFSCHWSFCGIVITSKFNVGFNTDTAVVLYFHETLCFNVIFIQI